MMITLNDVLASEKPTRVVSLKDLDSDAGDHTNRSIYKTFAENQQREEARVERSPLVVWAQRALQSKSNGIKSKLTMSANNEVQESAF
jgi:hypothetical protein